MAAKLPGFNNKFGSVNSHVAIRYYDSLEQAIQPSTEGWDTFLEHSQETALLRTYNWLERGPELGRRQLRLIGDGYLLLGRINGEYLDNHRD